MAAVETQADSFVREREPFLRYLAGRVDAAPPASLRTIVEEAGGPEKVAIVAVDVVNGFCVSGALASERVGAIVPPIAALLARAAKAGIRDVALVCEGHSAQAEEFHQFAPHCVAGTVEAEPVDALKALPTYNTYTLVRKNSISPWHSSDDLSGWVRARMTRGVGTFIAVGDCTDLCLHQFAVPLKLGANQLNLPVRIIVPRDCAQTYDLGVEVAASLGAMPHDGDLLHEVFLYHMALNGIEVVGHIDD